VGLEGLSRDDAPVTREMMARLAHRGPDGDGIWIRPAAILGHRRLAIIDLEGGDQPLYNETGTIGTVFNGEIFNYRELRDQLASAGHLFRTRSDTEVIVHAYEQWGDDFIGRLRGMFAFALWDDGRRRMLLGRDRFGIKPLYYARPSADRLIFASEIKALFADPRVAPALNRERLSEYFVFRCVSDDQTLFAGVRQVRPGTMIVIEHGAASERRYWSPAVEIERHALDERLVAQGRGLLQDAVGAWLASDVALGSITSGGLDSSVVSAVASDLLPSRVETFCVGFADPACDERGYARLVAERIGSRHHEIEVTADQIDRELDRLTWAHDEPLSHPNSIPMHPIFRYAKEQAGVTVLLSGEGADEVFGGYGWYAAAYQRDRLSRIPGLATLSRVMPPIGKLATLRKVLGPEYLLGANRFVDARQLRELAVGDGNGLGARASFWPAERSGADGMFIYDQRSYLPPLLQRQDRMSMAAGLEARVPFLDHPLVEWANAIPAGTKIAGGVRKLLLKKIAARWLPAEIVERKKVGFEMPIGRWMLPRMPLHARVEALRGTSSVVTGLVEPRALRRVIQEHMSGTHDHGDVLWSLIALDSWGNTFLRGPVRVQTLPGAATGRIACGVRL
jgi:asparagine synthase (glutamine-hydrolysing)